MNITWRTIAIPITLAAFLVSTLIVACAPAATPTPATQAPQSELEKIDNAIANAMTGNLAYNAPQSMQLDDTATVQVLLSPSLSPAELKQQITASGEVIGASLSITPRMRAELKGGNPEAFSIQPLHENAEQVLSTKEPTEWKWLVYAKKEGKQRLTLTLYRLVVYDQKEYWPQKSYEHSVEVNVTITQRLEQFDWKWIAGILLTTLLIPAAWRWVDRRHKGKGAKSGKHKAA